MGYLRTNSTLIDTSKLISYENNYVWYMWDGTNKQSQNYQFVTSSDLSAYPIAGVQGDHYYYLVDAPIGAFKYSWGQLHQIVSAKRFDILRVGDIVSVNSSEYGTLSARILELNDSYYTRPNVVFEMLIPYTVNMIDIQEVHSWLNVNVLGTITDTDLTNNLVTTTRTAYDTWGTDISLKNVKFWLLTELELFGKTTYSKTYGHTQYSLYKDYGTTAIGTSDFWLRDGADYSIINIDEGNAWCYSSSAKPRYTLNPTTQYKNCKVTFALK